MREIAGEIRELWPLLFPPCSPSDAFPHSNRISHHFPLYIILHLHIDFQDMMPFEQLASDTLGQD
jgi:hypothetical protein